MSFLKSLRWYAIHPVALPLRIAGALYERLRPNEPWIAWRAIRYCREHLSREMIALEWGSGRSTRWFANRVGNLTSVEHHEGWYRQISASLTESGIKNIDYRFVPLDHPAETPCEIEYTTLPKYVAVAETFTEQSVDFVVVDGHYRQTCVRAALPILKPGGLLLVDNSNWMPLTEWGVPGDWPIVHRSSGFYGETTIWKKP